MHATGTNPSMYGLWEWYVLGCIGVLPAHEEARIRDGLQRRYGPWGDWRAILGHQILHLDPGTDDRLRQMWDDYRKKAALENAQPDAAQFARLALQDECFSDFRKRHRGPEIPAPIRLAPEVVVRAVGFWRGNYPESLVYPRAQWLVRRRWHASELKNIIAYLKSGYNAHVFGTYAGLSTCRFRRCGRPGGPGEFNGRDDLTDGQWGWPQGLAHYLEFHSVILPEEFVDTMRANNWCPPPRPDPPHPTKFNHTFWIEWSRRNSRRGIFRWLPWS